MVRKDFIARHYLIGGDWGPENEENSHHFTVELLLYGTELNEHGYLVDIVAAEDALRRFVERYRDTVLNDHTAFEGINPSVEHFARIAWEEVVPAVSEPTVSRATVRMWENDSAYAEYSSGVEAI
jgi:6-pyruvoyltetrahydropterin/6-carboxytetrahydropterin synthase